MKALLTGATGFLGQYILNALEAQGYTVTTLGRQPVADRPFIQADLADPEAPLTLPEAYQRVIHAAGQAHVVPASAAEAKPFWDLNDRGTRKLLEALEAGSSFPDQLIFISSVSVYGLEAGTNLPEDTPALATNPYGASKRKAEEAVLRWCDQHKVNGLILRLPLVAGRNPPGNLGSILNAIQQGKYFGIGHGQARKSMVLAADVAELTARVHQAKGIYHLTDGVHPSFRELEQVIQQSTGKRIPTNLPKAVAAAMGKGGDWGSRLLGRKLPFDSGVYRKMTQSLTFADQEAREHLNWRPRSVLQHWPSAD